MGYKINLISDTVTKPTKGMLDAMMQAKVGDDVFNEDPTVKELEHRLAQMFSQEAGLFCPSGTMANQIAIKCHTQPMDELLCDVSYHVYQYEVAGYGFLSGLAINPIRSETGKLTLDLLQNEIKPDFDWLPRTKLLVLENSLNRAGGSVYSIDEIKPISNWCRSNQLKLHCDGARLFNALTATGDNALEYGKYFDSINICLSKGLGAPVGSVLLGSKNMIKEARRIRKALGGGMRQVGILAAAGIYALDHHVARLSIDHEHAKMLEQALMQCEAVERINPVQTNIIIFHLKEEVSPNAFIEFLHKHNVHASMFGKRSVRFVTHLDIDNELILETMEILKSWKPE